jgi:hypothetical protein
VDPLSDYSWLERAFQRRRIAGRLVNGTHAPDHVAHVVGHQQCAAGIDSNADWPTARFTVAVKETT